VILRLIKRHIGRFSQWVIITVASVLIVSSVVSALVSSNNPQSGSYVVLASVSPVRYIIIDSNFRITEVISNTSEDVIPTVLINSVNGSPAPYTDSIRTQFTKLSHTIDFSKAGIVYQRSTRNAFIQAIINIWDDIKNIVFG